jgi:hypothetical protein
MSAQEGAQSVDLPIIDGVWVDTDGPKAAVFFDRRPKLLWNPGNTVADKWHTRKSIGE